MNKMMESLYGNRILWLCLVASLGILATCGIAADIHQVRTLTEIKHEEDEERMISQGTEDALKLETLHKLSESSSFDLRAAALRIVSERSTKGATRDLLLQDLASKEKERRNRALTAIHFLVSNRALSRSAVSSRLKDSPTYTALVDCLCNFLDEHTEKTSTTQSPILPKTRPPGEKRALSTLNILLSENIPAALEAGVVSRWLCNYPFPCLSGVKYRRRDVVWLMKTWWTDDSIMSSIINTLMSHQDGIRQLRKYGLVGSMEENDQDDDDSDSDVWMVDGEDTAGMRRFSGRRPPEDSPEEQALRRRRREAMVLSEGRRPLGNDNIIQPPHSE